MNASLSAFDPHTQREDGHRALDEWAATHLDRQVLQGSVDNTKTETEWLLRERNTFTITNFFCANLILEAHDGTKFGIHAPQALQTCTHVRNQFELLQPNAIFQPSIELQTSFSPYILSRMIAFWLSKKIEVEKQKKVYFVIQSSEQGTNLDITDQISTSEALVQLHAATLAWGDEPMKRATLAKLRHHLISNKVEDAEILDGLKAADRACMRYPNDGDRGEVKCIFLSALARNCINISTGGGTRDQFKCVFVESPNLGFEINLASLYYTAVRAAGLEVAG